MPKTGGAEVRPGDVPPAPAPWLAADWPAPPGVRVLTTLRGGPGVSPAPFDRLNLGAHSGDDVAAVERNRDILAALAGLPSPPRWLRQVHGTQVVACDPVAVDADPPEGDAAVASAPGAVLAILTADCLPVAFASRDGLRIGAAHAGWRGLAAGVLEATLAAIGAAPGDCLAWLGPCAGPQAYEVGAEVRAAFVGPDPGAAAAFEATRPGHWRVDLYALARRRLVAAGMAAADVHGGGLCTISDPARFYSHRRDARTGRMATLVWRVPEA